MQIVVDGLLTHYQRQGKGKTLLMLHGWGDSSKTFQSIAPELSDKYELIALDLPGFGQTEAPNVAWDLDDYSAFLEAFLKKLEIHDLQAVIGHSNGGALAVRAFATNKLHAQKLVLLAASGVRDSAKVKRTATKVVAKTGKVATFWLPETSRQKLRKKLYGTVGSDMLVAPQLQETFEKTVRQDIQKDARNISVPTILIYGDQDRATPLQSVGERLHTQISGSQLKVISGADHFVHQTAGEAVVKTIQEFLS